MRAFMKTPCADTRLLATRLLEEPVGGCVRYEELSALIAQDVQADGRGTLSSARRLVQREHRAVFGVERGLGLIRLDDAQIVEQGANGLGKARRAVKRSARVLACVADFDALPEATRTRHNTLLSMFGALHLATSMKSYRRVEQKVANASSELAARRTLELFTK